MKKISVLLLVALVAILSLTGCKDNSKVITVCASDVPHAEVLEGKVKSLLAEQGYTLKVTILDWSIQNDAVANKDYDANYFQHQPYLSTYTGSTKLALSCTVHYEPLGIYQGKSTSTDVTTGTSFEVCDDVSNAIRAFQLLAAKGVITADEVPTSTTVTKDGDEVTVFADSANWNGTKTVWSNGTVTVTLIAENLLVANKGDYDFACLPCNTAYTGNVTSATRVAVEDDASQVATKANGLACRVEDYKNDSAYKAKIDALTDALLSSAVSDYFASKYLGAMTCDSTTQIDLRANIK